MTAAPTTSKAAITASHLSLFCILLKSAPGSDHEEGMNMSAEDREMMLAKNDETCRKIESMHGRLFDPDLSIYHRRMVYYIIIGGTIVTDLPG